MSRQPEQYLSANSSIAVYTTIERNWSNGVELHRRFSTFRLSGYMQAILILVLVKVGGNKIGSNNNKTIGTTINFK